MRIAFGRKGTGSGLRATGLGCMCHRGGGRPNTYVMGFRLRFLERKDFSKVKLCRNVNGTALRTLPQRTRNTATKWDRADH